MAGGAKRKTTMAKLAREHKLRERRLVKQERKDGAAEKHWHPRRRYEAPGPSMTAARRSSLRRRHRTSKRRRRRDGRRAPARVSQSRFSTISFARDH